MLFLCLELILQWYYKVILLSSVTQWCLLQTLKPRTPAIVPVVCLRKNDSHFLHNTINKNRVKILTIPLA